MQRHNYDSTLEWLPNYDSTLEWLPNYDSILDTVLVQRCKYDSTLDTLAMTAPCTSGSLTMQHPRHCTSEVP